MTNTVIPVVLSNGPQLIAGCINTGQVRSRFKTRAILNTFNNAVRAVALTRVCTVGD